MKHKLLASSNTFDGIVKLVQEYFCNPEMEILTLPDDTMVPAFLKHPLDNTNIYVKPEGYCVIKKKNRYRFELKE